MQVYKYCFTIAFVLFILFVTCGCCKKKPETARLELSQLGYNFTNEGFRKAIVNEDKMAKLLFYQAQSTGNIDYYSVLLGFDNPWESLSLFQEFYENGCDIDKRNSDGFSVLEVFAIIDCVLFRGGDMISIYDFHINAMINKSTVNSAFKECFKKKGDAVIKDKWQKIVIFLQQKSSVENNRRCSHIECYWYRKFGGAKAGNKCPFSSSYFSHSYYKEIINKSGDKTLECSMHSEDFQ